MGFLWSGIVHWKVNTEGEWKFYVHIKTTLFDPYFEKLIFDSDWVL